MTHTTQQHHGGDDQREVIHEKIVAGSERSHDQPDGGKAQPHQQRLQGGGDALGRIL